MKVFQTFFEFTIVFLGEIFYNYNNKTELSGYPIKNADEFIGFVCGIVSQDHDLQEMYLDSFLKNAKLEGKDITDALHQLKEISEAYKINFVLSVSMDKEEIPAEFQDDIIIAL